MKKKRILDIGFGRKTLFELFKSTDMSSRLQYGLAQLEDVYDIEHVSLERQSLIGTIMNNLKVLGNYDVVFMTYLYLPPFLLLSLLRKVGLFKKRKLVAISHVSLVTGNNFFEIVMNRCIYDTFDKILFHSQKNLDESVNKGLIESERADFLLWGDDLDYVDRVIHPTHGDFFLSTGREQRDFRILVSAFSKTKAHLELYTNRVNYDNNYDYLAEMQGSYSNVEIVFVEKSVETTRLLAQRSAECMCVVIPLIPKEVYYCLGLTSIIEAMAMGKPVITTRNPYHPVDIEKEQIGFVVDGEDSWIKAINFMISHPDEVRKMGERARFLAEKKYNIRECACQINRIFNE